MNGLCRPLRIWSTLRPDFAALLPLRAALSPCFSVWGLVLCLLMPLFSVVGFSQVSHASEIEKVRIGQHDNRTRVVLESKTPLKYKYFTLPSPDRAVFDFKNTEFKTDLAQIDLSKSAILKGLRQGLFTPDTTRMVMDLAGPVQLSVFTIPPSAEFGFRLVIDILPTTPGTAESARARQIASENVNDIKVQTPAPVIVRKAPTPANAPIIIVLDPGHGGVDPGAIGKGRTREKDLVLEVSTRLKRELEKLPNVKVYRTRDKDIFVPLRERVAFAQQKQADIFISLHADAHEVRSVSGGTVYVVSERASDREAARLAKSENEVDVIAGVNLADENTEVRDILISLSQRETRNQSALLGRAVHKRLENVNKMRKRDILFAGFLVLKAPDVPSILVELDYLSNPAQEKRLRTRSHQEKLVGAIASGVKDYIAQNIHR